jgi:hypothetical protein
MAKAKPAALPGTDRREVLISGKTRLRYRGSRQTESKSRRDDHRPITKLIHAGMLFVAPTRRPR